MGFSLGSALGGALGGFLSGGPGGALAGGLMGGFGGGDTPGRQVMQSGKSESETESSSSSRPNEFQMPAINTLLGGALSAFNNPNPQTIGFTPSQIQGQGMLLSQAAPQTQALADASTQSLGFLMDPSLLDPSSNPYLAASVQASINPVLQNLTRNILPGLESGAVQAGGIGGSRQGVLEANAINDFMRTAGDISAQQYANAYQQGLGTMLNANAQAPALAALYQQPGNIFNQVGSLQQAQSQLVRDEEIRRLQQLQALAASQIYGQESTSSSSTKSEQVGNINTPGAVASPGQALGAGMALGGMPSTEACGGGVRRVGHSGAGNRLPAAVARAAAASV